MTEVVMKKCNEIFLFAKASEAEIWTRIRHRYLTSFPGLHSANYARLTELDAAEDRQNSQCVSKMRQQRKHYCDVIGQAKNRLYFYHDKGIIGRGLKSFHNSN